MSDLLIIWANHLQKWVIRLKLCIFCMFFPFLCLKQIHPISLCSFTLFLSDLSDSLPSLFTNKLQRAIRSGRLWQKSNHEQFAQVALDKRATGAICSVSWAYCSFALSLTKNEQIAQKTAERIPNPGEKATLRHEILELGCHNNLAQHKMWQHCFLNHSALL